MCHRRLLARSRERTGKKVAHSLIDGRARGERAAAKSIPSAHAGSRSSAAHRRRSRMQSGSPASELNQHTNTRGGGGVGEK